MLEKNPNRRPMSAEKVIRFLDGRIDETELVGRAVADPIPVLGAAEIHSTAGATSVPAIPSFPTASSDVKSVPDQTNPSNPPVLAEATTNRGLAGPVAGLDSLAKDDSTMMVPTVFGDPHTQSDVATAFTEQPQALRDAQGQGSDVSAADTTSKSDEPSVLSGISADETTQLPAEQLQEAVELLKKRRSNPKGLVRRRPSSSLTFKGIKRKGPHTPTPSGSTGLNLRTLPPPPQAPRPPIWALVTMGVAIAVISVSIAALVITGGQNNQAPGQVHQDRQTRVPAEGGANVSAKKKTLQPAGEPVDKKADEQIAKPSNVKAEPVLNTVVNEPVVEEEITAGSLVGERLANLEIIRPVEQPSSGEETTERVLQKPLVEPKPTKSEVKPPVKAPVKVVTPTKRKPANPITVRPVKPKVVKTPTTQAKKPVKSVPKKKKLKKRRNPKGWTF